MRFVEAKPNAEPKPQVAETKPNAGPKPQVAEPKPNAESKPEEKSEKKALPVKPERKEDKTEEKVPPIPKNVTDLIVRFGKPDEDYTNARNTTRPKVVLRWLVYKAESVRITYEGADEEKIPKAWKFKSVTKNDAARTPLTPDEALALLVARDYEAQAIAERKRQAEDPRFKTGYFKLPDDPDQFIARFGKPDDDEKGERSRKLLYKYENVLAEFERPENDKKWKLAKTTDKRFFRLTVDGVLGRLAVSDVERKRFDEANAAKRKAIEDAKPKVTRANYNEIKVGMTANEVQAILGPGKESASSPGFLVATWQSRDRISPTIISITFRNGRVASKAIVGP